MSTSKKDKAYHHGDLRQELIAAALALLAEEGEQGPSLRAVARRAGVSPMAPYRHFADKAALIEAVTARGFETLAERLQAADASRSTPAESLAAQGAAYIAFAGEHPVLFRLMFTSAHPTPGTELGDAADRAYRVLSGRAASIDGPLPAADLTLLAWSLVHGLAALIIDRRIKLDAAAAAALAERLTGQFAALAAEKREG